ncbi:MAG: hypothetical protein JNL60_15275 [Bacteroidia bacterium]|nr:hypothetical protein [Bacteroidia bacterium]
MNAEKNFEKLLRENMSPENSDIDAPDAELVFTARQMIGLRKREPLEKFGFIQNILHFFRTELRLYPVGISVLFLFGLVFYFNEPNYGTQGTAVMSGGNEILSLRNTTISVNSSTMLTSIPTLRY